MSANTTDSAIRDIGSRRELFLDRYLVDSLRDAPLEHFYVNQTPPYFRAPHISLRFH
jgi:hypothetical protein